MTEQLLKIYYKQYGRSIFLFLVKRGVPAYAAEDIVSECFIGLYRSKIIPISVKAYLFKSAKHRLLNYRKIQGRAEKNFAEFCIIEDDTQEKEQLIEKEARISQILEHIRSLPPRMKEVMELILLGLSTSEISIVTGSSRQNILNSKAEAIKYLRNKLKKGRRSVPLE